MHIIDNKKAKTPLFESKMVMLIFHIIVEQYLQNLNIASSLLPNQMTDCNIQTDQMTSFPTSTEEKTFWEVFCKALNDRKADPMIQEFAASLKKYAQLNGVAILEKKNDDSKETRLSSTQQDNSQQPAATEQKVYPSFKRRNIRDITNEQQRKKYQEEKFIAHSFITHGLNFRHISQFFPNMTPKAYRCTVEAINNTNVNDIVDFLRYENRVEIQRLNRDQKRTIRTRLTKIHEWLGQIDKSQLKTYHDFIRRHYDKDNKNIIITEDRATKLYRTILGTVKNPFVNVLEADDDMKFQNLLPSKEDTLSIDEYKAILILYKEWRDIDKVRETLSQRWGYVIKYSYHSVKNALKKLIDDSINKLISNLKKADLEIYKDYFTDQRRNLIKESQEMELKLSLYDFYLEKQVNGTKMKYLLFKINDFLQIFPSQKFEASVSKLELMKSQSISMLELMNTGRSESQRGKDCETEDEVKEEEA